MDAALRHLVRRRADGRCEYCRLVQKMEPLSFHIEHIVSRQHGGTDSPDNLALASHHCNLRKGTNLTAIDTDAGLLTRLFHPRQVFGSSTSSSAPARSSGERPSDARQFGC
jgi:hypothetical protein